MSMALRIARSVAAAACLLGLVVGVPVALWWLAAPRFDDVLDGGSVVDLLLRPDDGALLLSALALVAAVAWLVLVVSIVGELGAALMNRPAPRIDLPGFRIGGLVAAALVAALLGTSPALAASPTGAPPATTSVDGGRAAAPAPVVHGPTHVVVHRDTLWAVAQARLDDPVRWKEIYDLNVGRPQPDGGRLGENTVLMPGWTLVLPADAREAVTVRPGDTLTGLAVTELGDRDRADELFTGNAGRPQRDGGTLSDPGRIRAGWTLVLPASGTAAPSAPSAPPDDGDRPPPNTAPARAGADRPLPSEPAPESESDTPAAPGPTAAPAAPRPTAQGPTTPPSTPAAPSTTDRATAAAPTSDEASCAEPAGESGSAVLPALGGTMLVAAGVLAALALRRRRQLRFRPHGHRIVVPDDRPGRLEWTTRRDTPPPTVDRLDLALRSIVHPDLRPDAVPHVDCVERTPDRADVLLAAPATLPAPFEPTEYPDEWSLDLQASLPLPEEEVTGYGSPFPTLVTVGHHDGRLLLWELEQRGVLRVGGDPARARALLRHVVAELATSAAAEDVETFVLGLGDDADAFNPDRVVVEQDPAAALAEMERRAVVTRMELTRARLATTVEGRVHHATGSSWLPTVLVLADEPGDDGRARIEELSAAPAGTTGVAVIVLDQTDPDVVVHPDGTLTIDNSNGPWQAVRLDDEDGDDLAELLSATDAGAVPAGPADGDDPWASGMREDGSLDTSAPVRDEPDDVDLDRDPDGELDRDDPAEPVARPAPDPAATAVTERPDAGTDVDPEAVRRLAIVEHQDPALDDDLSTWHGDGPPSTPMIGILGEPVVRGAGPRPNARPSWFAEVLVYLSLHPAGVTQGTAATDLWPDGHRISPATIRHAFYGARRWAGRGLGGDPDATFVSDLQTDSSYRLRGHLLDWDLFRRLRKRAQARYAAGHPGAVADYRAALELIRGPVLSTLRPGGYAWLNNHDQRHDLQIPGFVVDTAHELVDIALDAGDTPLARLAAERARDVDVDVAFDRPLTDLMRVAHAEDARAELELYASILLDARGFDVPEELAPESFTVLDALLPAGPARRRA